MENPQILNIRTDSAIREEFIRQSIPFILRSASYSCNRYIDKSDDIYSVALIAFNNAIDSYEETRGHFRLFAGICIRNAVNDYFRQQNKHNGILPLSTLVKNNDGSEVSFDEFLKVADHSDTSLEIFSLKEELSFFGISFFDLPKSAPKSRKTRKICSDIAAYIVKNKNLPDTMYRKKALPAKSISEKFKTNKKVTERYRKYIIMAVLIFNGKYDILSSYLNKDSEEV